MDVDTLEHGHTDFATQEAAQRYVAHLKRLLPEVESAYQPSGVMPMSALIYMLAGSPFAIATSFTAGAIALAIGAAITAAIAALNVLIMVCGWVVCIFVVLTIVAVLGTYAFTFGVAGYWSAKVTAALGRWGKNRNAEWLAVFAALYSVAASFFLMWGIWVLLRHVAQANLLVDLTQSLNWILDRNWMFWTLTSVGAVIAALIAFGMGASFVAEDKFCEACEAYMYKEDLPRVSLGGLRLLALAASEGNVAAGADVLQTRRGHDGHAHVFHCPDCRSGFLDVHCDVKADYRDEDGSKEKLEENWIVGSCPLTMEQSQALLRLVG